MAYFDSAKNRTLWKKELEGLRRMKEQRMQNGYTPGAEAAETPENPHRIRITFKDLERMEYGDRQNLEEKTPFFAKEKTMQKQPAIREPSL